MQSVTGSYQSWTGFLRAACYNYKCPFDDQILIYAQRPDATAVLEMERWNKRFGRWVNRGAKSIAVFGDDGQNCLKLYFDVSDTHASRFARPLPIWTMHPAFEPEVIETLEATFGNLSEKENLADAVRSACHNAVADNFTDYLQDLRECREDILPLADFFRELANEELGRHTEGFDKEAEKELMRRMWAGNVRELKQTVRSAVLLTEGRLIGADRLEAESTAQAGSSLLLKDGNEERERIVRALAQADGNREVTAGLLGISRTTLYNKMKEYGIMQKKSEK